MIIDTIVSIAEKIFGMRELLARTQKQRREEISKFLREIAGTLEGTSTLLKNGVCPHGKCAEIAFHADTMASAIGDVIGQDKAEELANQLREAHNVEMLWQQCQQENFDMKQLCRLDWAAGLFRAASAYIRIAI